MKTMYVAEIQYSERLFYLTDSFFSKNFTPFLLSKEDSSS